MKKVYLKRKIEAISGLPASEGQLVLFISLAAAFAMLLNLGVQPLFLEEPRRVMVAMEMDMNQNLIVPRQLGEYYYKKPPFFNWVLLLMAQIFGGYYEWAMRLPTVLSTIAMGGLSYWAGRRYVNAELGWLSGLLFVCTGGILFDFSMLAEIDLFYSLVTYAAILGIFHFYQQKQYFRLFFITYLLTAVGILTKGLPSVAFTGISLVVFFVAEKRWKLLLSWQHMISGLICLALTGSYLFAYSRYADLAPFLQTQLGESSERTVAEKGFWPLLRHLFTYPPDTIKNLLPAAFFLVFLVRKDLNRLLGSNEFMRFSALMLIANFLPYWLAPGARQRYIYVLYPLAIILLVYAYQHRTELSAWRNRIFTFLVGLVLSVFLLGSLAVPFVPDFQFISYRYWLIPLFGIPAGLLLYTFFRRPPKAIYWLLLATVAGRLLFDVTVLPQRAHHSGAEEDRLLAEQIQKIVGEENVYLYCYQRISFTTVVYLNKLRGKPLERLPEKNTRDFFLLQKIAYDDPRKVYLTFEYEHRQYELAKFY